MAENLHRLTKRFPASRAAGFTIYFVHVSPGELEVGSAPFVEQDVHHGTLHIRGVQEVDGGQYSCVASSPAGTTAATVTLEVGGRTTQSPNRSYRPRKCTQ